MTGTTLKPAISTDLQSTLARDWALQVDTTDAAIGTYTGMIFVRGLSKIGPHVDPTTKDDSDLDSQGYKSDLVTSLQWMIDCEGTRKGTLVTSTFTPDPGQEFLRARGSVPGYPGRVHVRWWRLDGLPDAYEGLASVTWKETAGTGDDLQAFTLTLTGAGARVTCAKPTTP